jgi:hypothetical protein
LLQEALDSRDIHHHDDTSSVDFNINTTQSNCYLEDAIFAIFALYTLHQTNTLPNDTYTAKVTHHHPAIHHEQDLQRQWSFLPLGSASEGRIFRRHYKSPVRIDRRNYLSLMHLRDVCAAIVAECIHCGDNDEALCDYCSLATDGMHVIDRMMNDEAFFIYVEYHGPVGLEGLAGNPVFYNAYYGAEGGKTVRERGKQVKKNMSVSSTKGLVDSQHMLTLEKLHSIGSSDVRSDTVDLTSLSTLLAKHTSNLQSIQSGLHASRQRQHSTIMHQQAIGSDLKPRQRELVETTLRELWSTGDGSYSKPTYVDMVTASARSEKHVLSECTVRNDVNVELASREQDEIQEHQVSPNDTSSLPITIPPTLSSKLRTNIDDILSNFNEMVESVRQSILQERNETNARASDNLHGTSVDLGATDQNVIDVGDQASTMYDEVSVSTGAGKAALARLLDLGAVDMNMSSTRYNQRPKKKRSMDDFLNLDQDEFMPNQSLERKVSGNTSDGLDEFSVSTGAGKNALAALLSLSEYGDMHTNKKKRKRQQPKQQPRSTDIDDEIPVNDSSEAEDSSVSDSSIEAGRVALQSLLCMAAVNETPPVKQTKRSRANKVPSKNPGSASAPPSRKSTSKSSKRQDPNLDEDVSVATGGGKRALEALLSSFR